MKKKVVGFLVVALTTATLVGASYNAFEPAPAIGATFNPTESSSTTKDSREYIPIETKTAAGRDAEIRIYPDGKTRVVGVNDCTILTADNGTRYITDRNGLIQRNELVEIFGNKYVVKSDGTVASDELVSLGSNATVYADKNGCTKTNSIVTVNDNDYATDSVGFIVRGERVEATWKNGEKISVYTDENGRVIKSGFIERGSHKLYAKANGEICRNCIFAVNGKKYAVGMDGLIYKNDVVDVRGKLYVAGRNRYLASCERVGLGSGQYVFADGLGHLVTERKVVKDKNGVKYVASDSGYLFTDTTVRVNGVRYTVDKNGMVIKKSR